ncbi:MAG: RNA-guided endonuclease TnpB family protein, partial [Niallia sp.]
TYKVRASQYNHFTDVHNKKELSDRWNNDINLQRDLYSSFLIMNVKNNLNEIDRNLCFTTYSVFKELHDIELNRLNKLKMNGEKLISSMGI